MPPKNDKKFPPVAKLSLVSLAGLIVTISTTGTTGGATGKNRRTATPSPLVAWKLFWGDTTFAEGTGAPPATLTHTYPNPTTLAVIQLVVTAENTLTASASLTITPENPPNPDPPPATPPTILSLNAMDVSPSPGDTQIRWQAVFSEAVQGVAAGNFTLVPDGVTGAVIATVSGTGTVWVITALSGTVLSTGTLRLDLTTAAGITSVATGLTLGNTIQGATYTLEAPVPPPPPPPPAVPPTVLAITRLDTSPTDQAQIRWQVTFSEAVLGVTLSKFGLVIVGTNGAALSSIGGSGASYVVTAVLTQPTTNGTVGLNLTDRNGITSVASGLTLAATFVGQVYTVVPPPPPPPPPLPSTPSLTTGVSGTAITATWTTDPVATSYELERRINNGSFSLLATVAAPPYVDSGLTVGTTYGYRVRGRNTAGAGPYSNTSTQTVPLPPPSPDGTVATTIVDCEGATWTLGSNNETLRNGVWVGDGIGTPYKLVSCVLWVRSSTNFFWYFWNGQWNNSGQTTEPGTSPPPPPPPPPPPGGDNGGYRPQVYTSYGMNTVGGRGPGGPTPVLYRVNTLADTGAAATLNGDGTYSGEYRAFWEGNPANGPRFGVPEVTGYCDLHRDLAIANPYATFCGQAGPGPFVVRSINTGVSTEAMHFCQTHDLVFQHYWIVPGWGVNATDPTNLCNSGVQFFPGGHYNILFDHMTLMWHQDEGFALGDFVGSGVNGGRTDVTVWRCLVAEGLVTSPGSDVCTGGGLSGGHGIGGGNGRGYAVIQSLLANNRERNPWWTSAQGVVINSVVYDWAAVWGLVFTEAGTPYKISAIGNRLIVGPYGPDDGLNYVIWTATFGGGTSTPGCALYLADNTFDQAAFPSVVVSPFVNQLTYDPRVGAPPAEAPIPTGLNGPMPLLASTAVEAFVTQNAGARPLARLPNLDARVIANLANRTSTARYNTTPASFGGYPVLPFNRQTFPFASISNPWGVADSVGRTNFEKFVEGLAAAWEPPA